MFSRMNHTDYNEQSTITARISFCEEEQEMNPNIENSMQQEAERVDEITLEVDLPAEEADLQINKAIAGRKGSRRQSIFSL